jgi:hypothetical protein
MKVKLLNSWTKWESREKESENNLKTIEKCFDMFFSDILAPGENVEA